MEIFQIVNLGGMFFGAQVWPFNFYCSNLKLIHGVNMCGLTKDPVCSQAYTSLMVQQDKRWTDTIESS